MRVPLAYTLFKMSPPLAVTVQETVAQSPTITRPSVAVPVVPVKRKGQVRGSLGESVSEREPEVPVDPVGVKVPLTVPAPILLPPPGSGVVVHVPLTAVPLWFSESVARPNPS